MCIPVIIPEPAFNSFLGGGPAPGCDGKDPGVKAFWLRSESGVASFRPTSQLGTSHLDCQSQLFHRENHDENNLSTKGVVCGAVIDNFCIMANWFCGCGRTQATLFGFKSQLPT